MKSSYIIAGIVSLLLIGGALFSFRDEKVNIRNYPSEGTDIIAFGDSLVEGVGATEGRDFVSLLSEKIGMPIVNLGVSGNTTAQGLARLNELDEYNPKVVLLLLGGNDHLRKVPISQTFDNLGKIIKNIQDRGATVLLLGVRGNLLGDQFKPEYEKLHEMYQTAYVPDVLDGLFGDRRYMSDQIHPNDAGYQRIADRVYPEISRLIQE